MKYFTLICLAAIVYFLCNSCAKQSTPSGGPKDSIPPILVNSSPAKKQLNYKRKIVVMNFSETIALNNAKEQVIITPTVNKDFSVTAQKKTVTIDFEKDLQDSTTYTINMRDAVQDITEKNPARNLQLAFSTGPYIDSLIIDGTISDLLKDIPIKDATVALYRHSDTLNIFKQKPVYLTKTSDKGVFKIENLKTGKYFLYAFDDKNKNLIVDSKTESYGFIANPLLLDSSISNITIPLQRLDGRILKLTSARPYSNYFNIRASKSLTNFELISDSLKFISCFGEDKANVRVYNTFAVLDSIQAKFKATDSIGNQVDSTLFIKYNKKKSEPEKFSMIISEAKIYANTGLFQATLTFNKPVATIAFDSLYYQLDSLHILNVTEKETQWDFTTNVLTIKKLIDPKLFIKQSPPQHTTTAPDPKAKQKKIIENEFIIGTNTFISIDSDSSKKVTQTPTILREEETGILLATIQTKETNFIVQLLSKDYKVLQSITNSKSIKFDNLPPASYLIRVITDKNSNGKWDPGNFFKKESPEQITFYKNEKGEAVINLKANWEIGPLLINL